MITTNNAKRALWISCATAALLLGGCQTTTTGGAIGDNSMGDNANSTNNTDKAPTHWQINGKIGLTYPERLCANDCRQKSDQGKISWLQQGNRYTIRLSDPFDRVVMSIDGDAQMLSASTPEQDTIQTTPDHFVAILVRDTGNDALKSLNPSWLSHWATGRPAPHSPVQKSGDSFIQEGYQVTPQNWQQTDVGYVPSMITIKKERFTMRLAVLEWVKVEEK